MKSNEELQKDVLDAIKWEPSLRNAEIIVTAKNGSITLTGSVDSYSKKKEAEEAAKNVSGVKAVNDTIEIVFHISNQKSDDEIAAEIINAFKWHWDIPNEKVTVAVKNGWVFLTGTLEWNYQKEAAKNAVTNLMGVAGITNGIRIVSQSRDKIEKKDIENAIERNGHIDNIAIDVEVLHNIVTLKGHVDSWYQKSEAGRIAWNAPGVMQVLNDLYVDFEE